MRVSVLLSFALLISAGVRAFPPAPHHLLYGLVRDQFGNPIDSEADVILETSAGVKVTAKIVFATEPGVNYRLEIPMDAGLNNDLYSPTALRPTVPFKIKVRIGQITYLPIEMIADYSHLGEPSQKTLLNLTLGEDSDGDGIPDAWERALIARSAGKKTLEDIKPNDDSDGDGMSNLDEYVSGNYAFDSKDGFSLKIVGATNGNPVLEFTAVRGRTYTVFGCTSFNDWTPVSFKIEGSDASAASNYYATSVRRIRIEAITPPGQSKLFYKLMVQ